MSGKNKNSCDIDNVNKSYPIILNHREYNINFQKNDFNLRIEINNENIYFVLMNLNEKIDYIYENKEDLKSMTEKLKLNLFNHPDLEIILNTFDIIYKENHISLEKEDEDSYNLLMTLLNPFKEEIINKIKLYKKYMNEHDKYNFLFSIIKSIEKRNNNLNDKEELIKLKKKVKKLDGELIKNKKIIEEMNEKIKRMEKIEINLKADFTDKINNIKNTLSNELSRQNEIIKEHNIIIEGNIKKDIKDIELIKNEIKVINNKLIINEEDIKNIENKIIEKEININNIKEEINEIRVNNINNEYKKLIEDIFSSIAEIHKKHQNDNDIIAKKIDDKIKETKNIINIKLKINENLSNKLNKNIKAINDNFNVKCYELRKLIDKKYAPNESICKINYKFKKEPQNLKYKEDITNANTPMGWNDMFEVFISYKDMIEYLISPNAKNHNLDVFTLKDNKKILSLKGHKNTIRTIRYFIDNDKNINEYLISADDNSIVIIWNITYNFNIKYQIVTNYEDAIYSCLLIFTNNKKKYIITSTFKKSNDLDKSATKIYSFNDGQLLKYISDSNNNSIYYLLSWYNKKNDKNYIIQFSCKKIIINNLLEDELYSELKYEVESNYLSGFIFNKDNNDYLCSSSSIGQIIIWDLYNKQIFKIINTGGRLLAHIIQWNDKYIIVADGFNKSFKIIDLEENRGVIQDISGKHTDKVKCIKKIYHPFYGESLLSSSGDKTIKLWAI